MNLVCMCVEGFIFFSNKNHTLQRPYIGGSRTKLLDVVVSVLAGNCIVVESSNECGGGWWPSSFLLLLLLLCSVCIWRLSATLSS